jgi:hypothetical protein
MLLGVDQEPVIYVINFQLCLYRMTSTISVYLNRVNPDGQTNHQSVNELIRDPSCMKR